jgi:TPR repeat protein
MKRLLIGFFVVLLNSHPLTVWGKTPTAANIEQLRNEASQGIAKSQFKLGVMYALGQGVRQDYSEAVIWFRKAAVQGNADAQCILGDAYDEGQGVKQDYAEAMKWYRLAADQGDANAQFYIGLNYDA